MTRINIYAPASEDSYDKAKLLGHFDTASAEIFQQDTEWDGHNMIGVITRSQWVDEYLYHTKGGKWVRNHNASRYMNGPNTYEFLTDEEARDWLLSSQMNDEAVARFFGELPEEEDRRPGRPTVGNPVLIRLGDQIGKVNAYAAQHGINRAEAVRRLVENAEA